MLFLKYLILIVIFYQKRISTETLTLSLCRLKNPIKSMIYSTVTECFGYGVLWYPNTLLSFDLNLSSQNLRVPSYSDYQHFLYETITKFRKDGMNDVQIANWLNDNGHPTPRGNKFKNAHVHSIAKKRKRRLEILDREPTLSISNMNVRYVSS